MRDQELILSLSQSLSVEDIPNSNVRDIAQVIGMEAVIRLILNFDGLQIYIPKDIRTRLKRLYVQKNYTGDNAKKLAQQLDLAERTVYQWLDSKPIKTHEQTDLFESQQ